MPYETTTKARENVMRIEDLEPPERDDETLFDDMYLEHLQVSEYLETKALQRARESLRIAVGQPMAELDYRNQIQEHLLYLRWVRDQLARLRVTSMKVRFTTPEVEKAPLLQDCPACEGCGWTLDEQGDTDIHCPNCVGTGEIPLSHTK